MQTVTHTQNKNTRAFETLQKRTEWNQEKAVDGKPHKNNGATPPVIHDQVYL